MFTILKTSFGILVIVGGCSGCLISPCNDKIITKYQVNVSFALAYIVM